MLIPVVWVVLIDKDRFLLSQRSYSDVAGGSWVFPGGKVDGNDTTYVLAAYRKLNEKVGIEGKRFRSLYNINVEKYNINIFLCDKWSNIPYPACSDIIGVGWFNLQEMHTITNLLSPFISKNLLFFSYMMQHYDNHRDKWASEWIQHR